MTEPYTVLHGGFHKTASTYLQRILHRNQGFMDKRGVHYVHHRVMRKQFTVPCQENSYLNLGIKRNDIIEAAELRDLTSAFFEPLKERNPERLILSDENLAGHCGHCAKRGALYRFRDAFMSVTAREIPFTVREVHLAVRNYPDFYAAAYVEYIRSLRAISPTVIFPNVMVDRVMNNLLGWNGVITQVQKYFPEAKIYIWKFEDFRDDPNMANQIIRNLAGPNIDITKFKTPKDDRRRPSASARAMSEIQNLILSVGIAEAAGQIRNIQEQFPRNAENAGFDPWSDWERKHLSNLYENDIARLGNDPAVTIVKSDPLFS
ncbi:hypothetical protein CLV80_11496 [Yoonia maritima]|uniref:Sulfotransferase family protein n=1 Tax=Yoonia maritima TaxID=1435347 RepID=A0A2T0VUP0_9RHOB|nr:hypothetical protein [Yoonia maritima]PRY75059.1 hypothetical protein CLV80_11496 [Yoonia maritima]